MSAEKKTCKGKAHMKETISKQLSLLKKKRPNSAKEKKDKSQDKETSEDFKRILEKLKSLKTQRSKTQEKIEKRDIGKPPSGNKKRVDKKTPEPKMGDSLSENNSKISPMMKREDPIEKYQEILK